MIVDIQHCENRTEGNTMRRKALSSKTTTSLTKHPILRSAIAGTAQSIRRLMHPSACCSGVAGLRRRARSHIARPSRG